MQARCQFPRCHQPADLLYVGREVCTHHFRELCAAAPGYELELLAKISLTRNEAAEVVEAV